MYMYIHVYVDIPTVSRTSSQGWGPEYPIHFTLWGRPDILPFFSSFVTTLAVLYTCIYIYMYMCVDHHTDSTLKLRVIIC